VGEVAIQGPNILSYCGRHKYDVPVHGVESLDVAAWLDPMSGQWTPWVRASVPAVSSLPSCSIRHRSNHNGPVVCLIGRVQQQTNRIRVELDVIVQPQQQIRQRWPYVRVRPKHAARPVQRSGPVDQFHVWVLQSYRRCRSVGASVIYDGDSQIDLVNFGLRRKGLKASECRGSTIEAGEQHGD
jgi:hypothetical protein